MSADLWDVRGDYAYAFGRAKTLAGIILDDIAAGRAVDYEAHRQHLNDIVAEVSA